MRKTSYLLFLLYPALLFAQKNQEKNKMLPFYLKDTIVLEGMNNITFDGFGENGFPEYKSTCTNIGLAATVGANKLWPGGGLGYTLTGAGNNLLGIWDGGKIRLSHQELIGRVTEMDTSASLSSHSTNVGGLMIASGVQPNAKGICYQSNLKAWNFTNDRAEMGLAAPNLLVSNHSYANSAAWFTSGGFQYWLGDTTLHPTKDWKFGFYDSRTRQFDSIAFANPHYLIVKAAGNDRGSFIPPGTLHYIYNGTNYVPSTSTRDTVGPYDCIVTYGTAKNILTIGAVGLLPTGFVNAPINTLSFSSWGPTDDGRIKPDLVCGTNSSYTPTSNSDTAYGSLGGTSMASPSAAGALMLVQQHYHAIKNNYMKAATLKALAIHTADNCKTNLGPNYESGWGLLNAPKAVLAITDSIRYLIHENTLNNLDTFKFQINASTSDSIKFTLCWTDPPSLVSTPAYNDTTPKLINDLDLKIIHQTSNQVYYPFVLNPNNPANPATTGVNSRDNVEQIYLTGLPSGNYWVVITHKNNLLANQAQAFSLIGSGFLVPAVLPVKWLDFGAKNHQNQIELNWKTAQETNNVGFEIERSVNNLNYKKIGFVNGMGNTLRTIKYTFLDELENFEKQDALAENLYYRLKQIDFDGNFNYSKTITIKAPSISSCNSYPNPFSDKINVQVYSNVSNQLCEIQILNLMGQVLIQKNWVTNSNQSVFEVTETAGFNSGIYFLKVIVSGKSYIFKLIKT